MQRIVGLIYAIPLALIVFALILKSQGLITPRSSYATQKIASPSRIPQQTTPTKSIAPLQKNMKSLLSFDLEKSQVCKLPPKMGVIQISTLKGMAHVDHQEKGSHRVYVYKQDCVYSWAVGDRQGTKTCGIGKLLGMLQLVGSISSQSTDELLGTMLKSSGISLSAVLGGEFDISSYCHLNPVDTHLFDLPTGVAFSEGTSSKN